MVSATRQGRSRGESLRHRPIRAPSATPLWARFSTHDFLIGDPVGSLYNGKLVEGPNGRPYFLAWRKITPDGTFVGELADPFQVAVDGQGNLSVGRA
ncbi:MAG: Fructan 6-exohydrolase [Rubrobacteraceae bacterium]|nr:Fructan 6-exohydrolase [Rubrobacteraceae bacterium]